MSTSCEPSWFDEIVSSKVFWSFAFLPLLDLVADGLLSSALRLLLLSLLAEGGLALVLAAKREEERVPAICDSRVISVDVVDRGKRGWTKVVERGRFESRELVVLEAEIPNLNLEMIDC